MSTTHGLTSKVALVTGGAKRVGRAVAIALAREGMDVAITFRASRREAEQTVSQVRALGHRAHAIEVELEQPDAAEFVLEEFTRCFDRLDALVNNASCFGAGDLDRVTVEGFDRHMAVNARAPLMLIQQFAPLLGAHVRVEDPSSVGRVVNLVDAHVVGPPMTGYVAYSASKAALVQITRVAAVALAPRVTVNAIAPGVVAWAEAYTEPQRRRYLSRVPLARAGTPEDAAAVAVFLIRDAHYCTGQVIPVDGGRLLT